MTLIYKTIKLRVRDKYSRALASMAWGVNQVWNYNNDLSHHLWAKKRYWLSGYEASSYTRGSTAYLGITSSTVQYVNEKHATARRMAKRSKLAYRDARAKGWIPLKKESIRYLYTEKYDSFKILRNKGNPLIIETFHSTLIDNSTIVTGELVEDRTGKWYLCLNVKISYEFFYPVTKSLERPIGIDLGIKSLGSLSTGEILELPDVSGLKAKISASQRANNKKRVRSLYIKMQRKRLDYLHKITKNLTENHKLIVLGDSSTSSLVSNLKNKQDLYDSCWGKFKLLLEYKSKLAGTLFLKVNEAYTTQTCSCCGAITDSNPKGRAGLGIREWTCSACNTTHDRDVNAAKNILAVGYGRLAEEIA